LLQSPCRKEKCNSFCCKKNTPEKLQHPDPLLLLLNQPKLRPDKKTGIKAGKSVAVRTDAGKTLSIAVLIAQVRRLITQ
jgi:hypothetical protein